MSNAGILEVPALPKQEPPLDFHWTVDAFYRAYDAGVFGHSTALELIQGRIKEKMPPGPRHSYFADAIAHMLRAAMEPDYLVREEKSIHIAFDGEPVPDVSVVQGIRADYRERHPNPAEVALLVEVSDSTATFDLGGKALLYSQAGIRDYWVILVNEMSNVRHRQPTPEGYGEVTPLSGEDVISPLALPETAFAVQSLLQGD